MNKDECQDFVTQVYASYNQTVGEQDRKSVMRAWYDVIHDLPYEGARKELLGIVSVSPYMPKPGDIRRAYINRHNKIAIQPTPQVAWAIVVGIIRNMNAGMPYEEEIPEAVRRTMKLLGEILYSGSGTYEQQNFMRTYEQVLDEFQRQIYEIPEKGAQG